MSDDLYQRAILDLAKAGAAATRLANPDASATVDNPLCGDRVTVDVTLIDGRIATIGHKTRGCALCQASAALLATTGLGLDAATLATAAAAVGAALHEKGSDPFFGSMRDFAIFAPVRRHPSRVGCVLLPFEALATALAPPSTRAASITPRSP